MPGKKGKRSLTHQQVSEMWHSVNGAMAHLSNLRAAVLASAPDEIMPSGQLKTILHSDLATSGISNKPDTKPAAHYSISFMRHKTIVFPGVHNKALCTKVRDDIAAAVDLSDEQTTIQPTTSAPHPGWDQVID